MAVGALLSVMVIAGSILGLAILLSKFGDRW